MLIAPSSSCRAQGTQWVLGWVWAHSGGRAGHGDIIMDVGTGTPQAWGHRGHGDTPGMAADAPWGWGHFGQWGHSGCGDSCGDIRATAMGTPQMPLWVSPSPSCPRIVDRHRQRHLQPSPEVWGWSCGCRGGPFEAHPLGGGAHPVPQDGLWCQGGFLIPRRCPQGWWHQRAPFPHCHPQCPPLGADPPIPVPNGGGGPQHGDSGGGTPLIKVLDEGPPGLVVAPKGTPISTPSAHGRPLGQILHCQRGGPNTATRGGGTPRYGAPPPF